MPSLRLKVWRKLLSRKRSSNNAVHMRISRLVISHSAVPSTVKGIKKAVANIVSRPKLVGRTNKRCSIHLSVVLSQCESRKLIFNPKIASLKIVSIRKKVRKVHLTNISARNRNYSNQFQMKSSNWKIATLLSTSQHTKVISRLTTQIWVHRGIETPPLPMERSSSP